MDYWHIFTVSWQTEVLHATQHHSLSCVLVLGSVLEPGFCHHPCTEHHRNTAMQLPFAPAQWQPCFPHRPFPESFCRWCQVLGESWENEPVLLGITCKMLGHHWPTYPGYWRKEQCKLPKKHLSLLCRYFSTFLLYSGEREHTVPLSDMLKYIKRCNTDKWGSGDCFLLHCSPCAKIIGFV